MQYSGGVKARLLQNSDQPSDCACWEWQCRLDRGGYGQIRVDGKYYRVHRVSYEAFVGPIPEGLTIDHLCRNRRCINPKHLKPKTFLENMRNSARALQACCKNGHLFDGANTYFRIRNGNRGRICRACNAAAARRLAEKRGGRRGVLDVAGRMA